MKKRLMIAMEKRSIRLLPSAPEERLNIAATPHYMQYEDVLAFNTVNNDIFRRWESPANQDEGPRPGFVPDRGGWREEKSGPLSNQ
jgi:hypothetical protein